MTTKAGEPVSGTLTKIATSLLHEPHGDVITLKRSDAQALAKVFLEQPRSVMAIALEDLDAIERKEVELFDTRAKRDDLAHEIAAIEADIMDEVSSKRGEDGKATYTNDTMRKAAAAKLQAEHVELKDKRGRLRTVERAIVEASARIETLRKNVNLRQALLGGGRV